MSSSMDARPEFLNCLFEDNEAENSGGAVFNIGGSYSIFTNCVIANNTARGAGGIWNDATLTAYHCTITDNTATLEGGGLYNLDASTTLVNSIIWGNTAGQGNPELYLDGGSISAAFCDILGGWSGTGNIDLDPLFSGPTYSLLAGSPCIDAGMDAGVYLDITGQLRPFDYLGIDNNGSLPEFDVGAYETIPEPSMILLLGLGGLLVRRRRK